MPNRPAIPVLVALLVTLVGCGGKDRQEDYPVHGASAGSASVTSDSEFARMRAELDLTADQEVAFSAKVAAREAAMRAWNNGPDGRRLAAARSERTSATDAATRANLDAELTRLNESQWKVRTAYRAEVLQVLTAEQQQHWAGARLGERLIKAYGGLELDQAQQARVRAIAAETSAAGLPAGSVVADPYLALVLEPARLAAEQRIESEVLSAAQQVTLAQRRDKRPPEPAAPVAP